MKHLLSLSLIAIAASAHAQTVTLDQAKAQAGNVTPGDAPGFPITITQPGSYRLTGPLSTGSLALGAIEIRASHVTLDLGGFTVSGVRCTPRLCLNRDYSDAHGIVVPGTDAAHEGVVIRNGNVTGFNGAAIHLREVRDPVLEDLRLSRSRIGVHLDWTHNGAFRRITTSGSALHSVSMEAHFGIAQWESVAFLEDSLSNAIYLNSPGRILVSNSRFMNTWLPYNGYLRSPGNNLCGNGLC